METKSKAEWLFHSQGVKDEDKSKLDVVRQCFGTIACLLDVNLPEGRYKSLVLTKLEEAAMFATKSFTHG